MARYIHCPSCKDRFQASTEKYGELYETIEGTAIKDMLCDGCGPKSPTFNIHVGDRCFAALLLPNKQHMGYEYSRPEKWAKNFIKPIESCTTTD